MQYALLKLWEDIYCLATIKNMQNCGLING